MKTKLLLYISLFTLTIGLTACVVYPRDYYYYDRPSYKKDHRYKSKPSYHDRRDDREERESHRTQRYYQRD